jgi:hypothetical protein
MTAITQSVPDESSGELKIFTAHLVSGCWERANALDVAGFLRQQMRKEVFE